MTRRALARAAVLIATVAHARAVAADSLLARVGPDAWAARLGNSDPVVRRGAADLLGRYGSHEPGARGELEQRFARETDASVQLAIVAALARGRFPMAACDLLRFAIGDRDAGGRATSPAARASALSVLRVLSPLPDVADELTRCPRMARPPAPVSPFGWQLMTPALGAAPPVVVDAATRALAAEPDPGFGELVYAGRGLPARNERLLRAIAMRGDARWAPLVIDQLRSPGPTVVLAALDAVATLRLVDAAADVAEIARNALDRSLRRAALRTLGALGVAPERDVVRASLVAPETRGAALDLCAALGDRAWVGEITPWLAATWAPDRRDAAEALGALGGDEAFVALRAALAVERDADARRVMFHAVARSEARGARTWLRSQPDASARWARLEGVLRGEERDGASEAGVAAGDPSSLALAGAAGTHRARLRALLGSANAAVRADAATAMSYRADAAVDDADQVALAAALSREDDEGTRVALVLALSHAGGDVARDALARLLEREAGEPSLAALVAADAARTLPVAGVAAALRTMLRAPGASVRARVAAARALGVSRDLSSVAALRESARFEPDPRARGAALIALAELAGRAAAVELSDARALAWTTRLADDAARAVAIAAGQAPRFARFDGASVVRASGASPRSVWSLWRPDGTPAYAVASGDGEIVFAGASASRATLERLDVP